MAHNIWKSCSHGLTFSHLLGLVDTPHSCLPYPHDVTGNYWNSAVYRSNNVSSFTIQYSVNQSGKTSVHQSLNNDRAVVVQETRYPFLLATHGIEKPLVLYIGRVNTVYCGVDTVYWIDDYRDPMLG